MNLTKKLWLWIIFLGLFSPLGLILCKFYNADSAWGEWGADQLQKLVGYVPQGFIKLSGFWDAPLRDYSFKGWEQGDMMRLSLSYFLSAVVGIAVIAGIVFFLGKKLTEKND